MITSSRKIIYILCNKRGKVHRITIDVDPMLGPQSETALLELYAPHRKAPPRFNEMLNSGYSLSNWHVIEP